MREKIYNAMMTHINSYIIEDALRCSARILRFLPHRPLNENIVFVAYGGGKDSSYIVSFVRLIQLLMFREHNTTFRLRIATNRHSGMPFAVMENIDRVYKTLGLYDDSEVELLLVDGNELHLFDVNAPLPQHIKEKNQLDILMTGHRCWGEARPTFCNACNLSMVNSIGLAVSYNGGVDVVVTGDSTRELRAYTVWVRQVATKFGLGEQKDKQSFSSFLHTIGDISSHYFQDIYGKQYNEELQTAHYNRGRLIRNPLFFSVYRDTAYQAQDHWELLTNFLGFHFDEVAFSFTESDCANPALMAHLRGLKTEHLYGRTYKEGIAEYTDFAINLMRKKDFPAHLIEMMQARYATPEAIGIMREKMDNYAKEVFDLSEEQLVCMLYSPFAQRGKNLYEYLSKEKPLLYPYLEHIHTLLADSTSHVEEQNTLEKLLVEMTHLSMGHLRVIYASDLSSNDRTTPISLILANDPHKAVISTLHRPDGPVVSEVITGR